MGKYASALIQSVLGGVDQRSLAKQQKRAEEERFKWLNNSDKVDKAVSENMREFLSPDVRVRNVSKYPTKTDAVQAAFPDGDPRKNLGTTIKRDFQRILEGMPEADPNEALYVATKVNQSLIAEDTYKFIRRNETALPFMGSKVGAMPGYENWLSQQQQQEETVAGRAAKAGFIEDAPENFAFGAGLTAAGIGAKMALPRILGRTAQAVPHPLAKIVLGGLSAIATFYAGRKAAEEVAETEWARARQVPGELDRADVAEFATEMATFAGLEGALAKGAKKGMTATVRKLAQNDVQNRAVLERLARFPTARNTLDAIAEERHGAKLMRDAQRQGVQQELEKETLRLKREELAKVIRAAGEKQQAEIDVATEVVQSVDDLPVARPINRNTAMPRTKKVKRGTDLSSAVDVSATDVKAQEEQLLRKATVEEMEETLQRIERGEETLAALQAAEKTSKDIEAYYKIPSARVAEAAKDGAWEVGVGIKGTTPKDITDTLKAHRKLEAKPKPRTILRKGERPQATIETAQEKLAAKEASIESEALALQGKERKSVGEGAFDQLERKKQAAVEAGIHRREVSFSKDNPPPFAKVLNGEMKIEDYAKMLRESPGLGSKEYDFVRQYTLDNTGQVVNPRLQKMYSKVQTQLAELRGGKSREAMDAEPRSVVGKITGGMDEVPVVSKKTYERLNGFDSRTSVIFGLAGATALGAMGVFSPDEAEASPVSSVAEMGVKLAKTFGKSVPRSTVEVAAEATGKQDVKAILTKMIEDGVAPPKVDSANPYKLQGFMQSYKMAPKRESIIREKPLPLWMDKWLSPHNRADHYYNKYTNPLVEIQGRTVAALNNTDHGMEVLQNILREVPELAKDKAAFNNVRKAMKALDDTYGDVVSERGYRMASRNELERQLKVAEKKLARGRGDKTSLEAEISEYSGKLEEHDAALPELNNQFRAFTSKWTEVVQELAAKHPTTRIALAAEDTANFDYYPWLRGMLTRDELAATSRIKTMMQDYAAELERIGEKPISDRPFLHHAAHPDRDFSKTRKLFERLAPGNEQEAMRLAKLHHRTEGSLQMMPDVEYVMSRYLPDINKRIQYIQFWDKKNANGWAKHSAIAAQKSKALNDFWRDVKRSFDPVEYTRTSEWARRYHQAEVGRLLFLSPSVAFKHSMKVMSTMSSIDFGVTQKAIGRSSKAPLRLMARDYLQKTGVKYAPKLEDEMVDSFIKQGSIFETIADFDLGRMPTKWIDKSLTEWNKHGSLPVRLVENFDRAHTVLSSLEMAAKKGMTPDQAYFSTMKMILQDNFIGGVQNPGWLKDPRVRAFLMFQGTPFKIFERRLTLAMQSGKAVKRATLEAWDLAKNIRQYMKEGELRLKTHLITDALKSESNIFGVPTTKVLMKEMLLLGAMIGVGREVLDVDLAPLAYHQPVVTAGKEDLGIRMNPMASAAYQAWRSRQYEDNDWMLSRFMQEYLGSTGAMPALFSKMARLSKNDIPEIYLDSRYPELSYIFAMPAVGSGAH